MTDYMKQFIEDNIKLIEDGKLDKLKSRCDLTHRDELSDILNSINAIESNESDYTKIVDITAFGNELRAMLRELSLSWAESYMNNGKRVLTYKFVNVSGCGARKYEIEKAIQDKLDSMNIRYDFIRYNSAEYICINMRRFLAATLRIRIIK